MQDEREAQGANSQLAAAGIDVNVPQSARVYDFLLARTTSLPIGLSVPR
jgi:hypothetical protein